MQISDLVKQYHQAISSGAETLTGTKGVENLVASLRSLTCLLYTSDAADE